jgi:cell division protein FtsZ
MPSRKPRNVSDAGSKIMDFSPIDDDQGEGKWGAPVIKVLGVGGGGCNAIARMYQNRIEGVEYFGINTDASHLARSDVPNRISIGNHLTRGLGVGGDPEMGLLAAQESRDELAEVVGKTDLLFLAVGMGGGTGDAGALTIAVVSRPFSFETAQRRHNADEGIDRLTEAVDTMIVIPNDRLIQLSDQMEHNLTWEDALNMVDSVLQQGIQAITEVVTIPGEINVDFADVKSILEKAGPAWLAIGTGKGDNRAVEAAQNAIHNPLMDVTIDGARRLLFVVSGGASLTLKELKAAADVIQEVADPEANIIFGTVRDPNMNEEVKVTLVAADFPVLFEKGDQMELGYRRNPPQSGLPMRADLEQLDIPSFLRRQGRAPNKGFPN